MKTRNAIRRSVAPGELPAFSPVPRKCPRHDGWTPERQQAFIAALADTGCVKVAARMVNMAHASAYQLRREPGATSFRAAWDAAQTLGLQVVKDEAFDRAMHGQLVPVFAAGRLMGFRRKKNDALLMFILRHYGQDAQGRKTTVNYFSTRATAGAGAGAQADTRPTTDPSAIALAKAEASTTTVRTVISGPDRRTASIGLDDESAANLLNAFRGVDLDAEARDQIYHALESCAERRRALEHDPENDSECDFVGLGENEVRYLGELESGYEDDWIDYKPEGERRWEGLGEGGQAAEIDKVLAGIAERRATMTPEEIEAKREAEDAMARAQYEQQNKRLPALRDPDPAARGDGSKTAEGREKDPRLDWRNWTGGSYTPPEDPSPEPG